MAAKRLYKGRGTKARMTRAFERRYGKRGRAVYGAVIGKVAREQAARRGEKVERVRRHESTSRKGRRFEVRAHEARLEGERYHPRGEYEEEVRGYEVPAHASRSRKGKREWVRRHHVRRHKARVRRF
jgi:hypothetical protein